MKSTLIFIAATICVFVGMFAYAIKDNNEIKEKNTFDAKIHSLGYGDALLVDELSNPFIFKEVESQLNENANSIYLGNTPCKKIRKDGETYLLKRDNMSIFSVNVSQAKLSPECTGKLLKISVVRI